MLKQTEKDTLNKRVDLIADEPTRSFAIALIQELDEIQSKLAIARRDRAKLHKQLQVTSGAIGCGVIAGAFKLVGTLSDTFLTDNTPFAPVEFKAAVNAIGGVFFALSVGIFIGKPGEILARILNIPISPNKAKPEDV